MCILNAGDEDAHVEITVYFADRAPAGPYRFTVGAKRTRHLRFNDFTDPEPVPKGTDFASVITSNGAGRGAAHAARYAPDRRWRC